jgi:hypothetical protein
MISGQKSIMVVKEMLKHDGSLQQELAKRTGTSIGLVNSVIRKLELSFFAGSKSRGIGLRDHQRLFLTIGSQNPLRSKLVARLVSPSDTKKTVGVIAEAFKKTPYAFTLLSALGRYSAAAGGETVSVYVDKASCNKAVSLLKARKFTEKGKGAIVEVYAADKGKLYDSVRAGKARYVSREQLILDFFSSQQYAYIANQLLEEYLGPRKL